jgi:hypothetical protein
MVRIWAGFPRAFCIGADGRPPLGPSPMVSLSHAGTAPDLEQIPVSPYFCTFQTRSSAKKANPKGYERNIYYF